VVRDDVANAAPRIDPPVQQELRLRRRHKAEADGGAEKAGAWERVPPRRRRADAARPVRRRAPCSTADESPSVSQRPSTYSHYSLMTRSAHSTNETNIAGLPHFAPQLVKSASVTPRAREQAPQEKTGMCLATTFSIISVSGGQPMGLTASTVALRIR